MRVNKRVYHAGDFKNKSENLSVGLHGTSFCSGYFFTTTKEACENQGAGFNKDHPRPVYSFDISNLDLFPTTWQDCKTLNLFNKALYYWPVYQTYFDNKSVSVYKKIYKSLLACFEDYYADNVAEEKRVSKFLRELKDSYIIEADDMAEIDGQLYSFQDYIDDTRSLKNLKNSLLEIESTFHNTLPLLSDFLINADSVDILKNKVNESEKRITEAKKYAIYTRVIDNIPDWMDSSDLNDSFNVDTKRDLIKNLDDLLGINKDPDEIHQAVVGISLIDDSGEYVPLDLKKLPRKYKSLLQLAENRKIKESESYLFANVIENIANEMYNYSTEQNDSNSQLDWLEDQAIQLFDVVENIYSNDLQNFCIEKINNIRNTIANGSGNSDVVFDFVNDIDQALKDLEATDKRLYESTRLPSETFYHVSAKPINKLISGKGVWIGSKDYVEWVADVNGREYVYQIKPKKDLNIFDAREPETLEEVKQYVQKNNIKFKPSDVCREDIEEAGVENWADYFELISEFADWQLVESRFMKKVAKDLGYDGFVSVESSEDYYENYFIFDSSNLEIVGRITEEQEIEYTFDDLKNELENFVDNFELASNIDTMLQKVADLVDVDKEEIIDIANIISDRYTNFYDKTTGRFDNWSINKNEDLFATQLLLRLGYQGTYPIDDRCDSTEWGGVVFRLAAVENAELV